MLGKTFLISFLFYVFSCRHANDGSRAKEIVASESFQGVVLKVFEVNNNLQKAFRTKTGFSLCFGSVIVGIEPSAVYQPQEYMLWAERADSLCQDGLNKLREGHKVEKTAKCTTTAGYSELQCLKYRELEVGALDKEGGLMVLCSNLFSPSGFDKTCKTGVKNKILFIEKL